MSPHRKLDRYLGLRGWLLLLCAGVWAHIGLGVYLHLGDTFDPELPHTHLPMWLRVGGWWASAALAAWASMWKTHVAVATGVLMLMPLQRLASYTWAWITYLIPGGPEGTPHGWYSVGWYVFLVGVVLITAHVREPTNDRGL
jgi:hypothetical protein